MAIVTAAATAWLWTEANDDPQLRIDAIRTGFTIGFGTGGALALVLAARRQWLQERAQAHQEEAASANLAHQERVAEASERDASERRITDLHVRAVDQLGSARAPVRLGGLYALERLAQTNPSHQRTVCDVICAYLRMPYMPPDGEGVSDDREELASRREELQVRLTAQRILASHLREHDLTGQEGSPDTMWKEVDVIDLTGAYLVDFDLRHCRVSTLRLDRATLAGESLFTGMTCSRAFIRSATFTGPTYFRSATFVNDASFEHTTFAERVWFNAHLDSNGTHFKGRVSFKGATFARVARFQRATFGASLDFSEIPEGAELVHLEGARMTNPKAVRKLPPRCGTRWSPDRDRLIITRDSPHGLLPPRQKREPDDRAATHDG